MPCSDELAGHCCNHAQSDSETKARLNNVTDLLCELLRELTKRNLPLTKRHQEWWDKHKEYDKRMGK